MRQLSFQWNKYHDFTTHSFFKILLQKVPKYIFFNDTGQFFTGTTIVGILLFFTSMTTVSNYRFVGQINFVAILLKIKLAYEHYNYITNCLQKPDDYLK